MDDLIKLVVQKTGVSERQAKQAVEIVLGFLKDKLPPALAGQVDGLLAGGERPDLGDLTKGLGGLFG